MIFLNLRYSGSASGWITGSSAVRSCHDLHFGVSQVARYILLQKFDFYLVPTEHGHNVYICVLFRATNNIFQTTSPQNRRTLASQQPGAGSLKDDIPDKNVEKKSSVNYSLMYSDFFQHCQLEVDTAFIRPVT